MEDSVGITHHCIEFGVGQVDFEQLKICVAAGATEIRLFHWARVIVGKAVDSGHLVATGKECVAQR